MVWRLRCGDLTARCAPFNRQLGIDLSTFVDLSSVPQSRDHNKEHVVLNGVDDAVVTDPDAPTRWALQRTGSRRSWILCEQRDRALDATADLGVELTKSPDCCRSEFDPVGGHTQPRSALTCSQGMLGPSSAIAASKSATSWASSKADISSS